MSYNSKPDQSPKPIDPALKEHLEELAALAAEIGALGTIIIRGPRMARLFVDTGDGPQGFDLAGQTAPPAGLLVILHFPASDGGAPGVEAG